MVGREFALVAAFIAWAGGAAPAGAAPAQGEKAALLRLCNPAGGIRADRTPRGLRIRYLDKADRPGGVDFTLAGWEVQSARASGKGGCVDLVKAPGGGGAKSSNEDVLSAKDEVIVYGGPFQDKVILRRGQRVIDLGGERMVIEETEVLFPAGKKRPQRSGKKNPGKKSAK